MSIQFDRKCTLTLIPVGEQSIVIRDLRFEFEITKSLVSTPNLARISVYNLSDETIRKIRTPFTKIRFECGYAGNVVQLFTGQIRNIFAAQNGVDRITTMYSGDGELDIRNSRYNKSVDASAKVTDIIRDIMGTFSESVVGSIEDIPGTITKLRSQVLTGSSKDILDTYAKEYNFQWSIQDGEVITIQNDTPPNESKAILITSRTGMVGSPTMTEIGADVKTLLNPEIGANSTIKIESISGDFKGGNAYFRTVKRTSAEGFYRVQEVVHTGDTRSSSWESNVKGVSLNV